ncbi:MAG TPA: type IV toxin-antitoxin system AbiEi family antitoxin domain-containing protein, partial [Solirubrobacterales bacterium]
RLLSPSSAFTASYVDLEGENLARRRLLGVMAPKKLRSSSTAAWGLVRRQHGVVTRAQLLALGFSTDAIRHRVAMGRLHPLWRGVYAVGRPTVSERGRWMAAVLSCGPEALLSHRSAAGLWRILRPFHTLEVVAPEERRRHRPGIAVHRRNGLEPAHRRVVDGIPVTDIVTTLIDLATCVNDGLLIRAVNQADRMELIDAEGLRTALDRERSRPGVGRLRSLLDRQGAAFADTLLELRFLDLVRAAGLPEPELQADVNGYRVDFYWPALGLVVETDGPRDHRTPSQQTRDRRRDHEHSVEGLTPLRFTEAQVRHEPEHVRRTLVAVAGRLGRETGPAQAGLRPESSRL